MAAGAPGLVWTSARPLPAQDVVVTELASAIVTTLARCLAGHHAAAAHGRSSFATTTSSVQKVVRSYSYDFH